MASRPLDAWAARARAEIRRAAAARAEVVGGAATRAHGSLGGCGRPIVEDRFSYSHTHALAERDTFQGWLTGDCEWRLRDETNGRFWGRQ